MFGLPVCLHIWCTVIITTTAATCHVLSQHSPFSSWNNTTGRKLRIIHSKQIPNKARGNGGTGDARSLASRRASLGVASQVFFFFFEKTSLVSIFPLVHVWTELASREAIHSAWTAEVVWMDCALSYKQQLCDWLIEPTWNLGYSGLGHLSEAFEHLEAYWRILSNLFPTAPSLGVREGKKRTQQNTGSAKVWVSALCKALYSKFELVNAQKMLPTSSQGS